MNTFFCFASPIPPSPFPLFSLLLFLLLPKHTHTQSFFYSFDPGHSVIKTRSRVIGVNLLYGEKKGEREKKSQNRLRETFIQNAELIKPEIYERAIVSAVAFFFPEKMRFFFCLSFLRSFAPPFICLYVS